MKVGLKKNIRMVLIAALAVLTLSALMVAVWQFRRPTTVEKEAPVYKYTQQAQVDYQVFFSANPYFPEKTAEAGRGYLTPLTEMLETRFHYIYNGSGEQAASVDGSYTVVAAVTGYAMKEKQTPQGMEKEKVKVWEKTSELVPATTFSSGNNKVEVNRTIPVDVRTYKAFADKVQEEYKSAVDVVELTVTYKTAVNINTLQKTTKDQIAPVLLITLKGNSFIVEGKNSDKTDKSITRPQTVAVPGVKTARGVSTATAALLMAALAFVLLRTTVKDEDELEHELEQIIKKYGDRIIACDGAVPGIKDAARFAVNSMDDLIKAGDELMRPVLYENVREGVHTFYVVHEGLIYVYTLEAAGHAGKSEAGQEMPS